MMESKAKLGFTYLVETVRNGVVIDSEVAHNIIPFVGTNHMLDVLITSGAQVATWFIGLYENGYAPQMNDTMATFPTLAGEISTYTNPSRHEFVAGVPAGGSISNADSRAEFDFTVAKTVRGGFIASTSTKGSTAGILLSAVQFPSPRVVTTGDILRVTAGLELIAL